MVPATVHFLDCVLAQSLAWILGKYHCNDYHYNKSLGQGANDTVQIRDVTLRLTTRAFRSEQVHNPHKAMFPHRQCTQLQKVLLSSSADPARERTYCRRYVLFNCPTRYCALTASSPSNAPDVCAVQK